MIQLPRFSDGSKKIDYIFNPLKRFCITLLFFALSTGFVADKPKILIIGDSISMGYTPFVKEKLAQKAAVFHNEGNAQHTGTGLKKITEWVGDEDWDIIQFNWGLWDLCYRHPDAKVYGNRDKINGKVFFPVEEYASNLDSLVTTLKKLSNAELIFVTTSYVPEGEAGRFSEDAIRYNAAAKEVMKKHGVVVNDIFEQSKEIHSEHNRAPNDVHYTETGSEKLGELIAVFLEKKMKN